MNSQCVFTHGNFVQSFDICLASNYCNYLIKKSPRVLNRFTFLPSPPPFPSRPGQGPLLSPIPLSLSLHPSLLQRNNGIAWVYLFARLSWHRVKTLMRSIFHRPRFGSCTKMWFHGGHFWLCFAFSVFGFCLCPPISIMAQRERAQEEAPK